MIYQSAIVKLLTITTKVWAPPPKLSLSSWSDRYAILSAESSAQPGKWSTIPYQRGIMDALTDPRIEKVTVMKSARVGYTKIINNLIGYHIHGDPCNILVVQPTIEDGQGYSKDEIAPMLRDTPVLAELAPPEKAKDSRNTILKKNFPGMSLMITGANSARGFRRISARVVIFDEVDGYPPSAGNEGDQITLGSRRAEYFWNKKIVAGSTPTVEGVSRISTLFEEGDQRYYYVPCPHCNFMQPLAWGNIDYKTHGTVKAPVYICADCEKPIEYRFHRWMVERGEWRATKEFNGHASFHIWAAYSYSPNATWRHIVQEHLDCAKDPERRKTWVNTILGETWKEEAESISPNELFLRREDYGPVMPLETALLTCTVDVQKDRFEILVKAWGYDEESWDLEHKVIHGNPALADIWTQLDAFIQRSYPHMNGAEYHFHGVGIDTGGHYTQQAYQFIKPRQMRNVFAFKGSSQAWKPVIPPKAGKRNKARVSLYEIGVSSAKDILSARLAIKKDPAAPRCPGYIHFPASFSQEYFDQLTAEKKVTRYVKGRKVFEWKLPAGKRNEALDIEVYSIAVLKLICPDTASLNRMVDLAAKPRIKEPEIEKPEPVIKRQQQHKRGFIDKWKL